MINKIDDSVYNDYKKRKENGVSVSETYFNPVLVNKLAEKTINKSIKSQNRNQRAMDYDISGQTEVNFVNDKNRAFNRKLERAFQKDVSDIKQ